MSKPELAKNAVDMMRTIEQQVNDDGGEVVGIAIFAKFGDTEREIQFGDRVDTFLASHRFPDDIDLWEMLMNAMVGTVEAMKSGNGEESPSPDELLS